MSVPHPTLWIFHTLYCSIPSYFLSSTWCCCSLSIGFCEYSTPCTVSIPHPTVWVFHILYFEYSALYTVSIPYPVLWVFWTLYYEYPALCTVSIPHPVQWVFLTLHWVFHILYNEYTSPCTVSIPHPALWVFHTLYCEYSTLCTLSIPHPVLFHSLQLPVQYLVLLFPVHWILWVFHTLYCSSPSNSQSRIWCCSFLFTRSCDYSTPCSMSIPHPVLFYALQLPVQDLMMLFPAHYILRLRQNHCIWRFLKKNICEKKSIL